MQTLAASLSAPVSVYALDVTDAAALDAAARDFIARHGVPDIVIANAGISAGTRADLASDIAVLSRIMHTNVVGLAATLQPFVAPMRERGSGALVGIASVAGFRGLAGAGAYSASKAAAITWLEAMRLELHGSGVDVVTICPGYIATPLTAANRHPMPFLLDAPEAARRIARAIAAKKASPSFPGRCVWCSSFCCACRTGYTTGCSRARRASIAIRRASPPPFLQLPFSDSLSRRGAG